MIYFETDVKSRMNRLNTFIFTMCTLVELWTSTCATTAPAALNSSHLFQFDVSHFCELFNAGIQILDQYDISGLF